MESVKCPRCQSENIEVDDVFDISADPTFVIDRVCAHCLDCKADITYDRIYKFMGYEDIQLEED